MSDKDRKENVLGAEKLNSTFEDFDMDAFDEVWDSVQISPTSGKPMSLQLDDKAAFAEEGFSLDVDVSAEFLQAMSDGKIRDVVEAIPAMSIDALPSEDSAALVEAVDSDLANLLATVTDTGPLKTDLALSESANTDIEAESLLDDSAEESAEVAWDSDLGEFSLELKAAASDSHDSEIGPDSEEWEDVGKAFGVESNDKVVLADADEASGDDVEADLKHIKESDARVGLSLRARLGRVYPEGEIVEGDHELGHDQYYSAAFCKAEQHPQQREHRRKRLMIAVIGCILILIIAVSAGFGIHKFLSKRGLPTNFVQKSAFHLSNQSWDFITVSESGRWGAMCSDSRGVVVHDSNVVSEFFPVASGCRGLWIDDKGSTLWYIDAGKQMHYYSPGEEFGFESHKGPELTAMVGTTFSVADDRVSYVAAVAGTTAREWRSIGLSEASHTSVSLPEDALVCEGSKPGRLAYVSGDSIYLINPMLSSDDKRATRVASLDAPKLACPRALAVKCALGLNGEWAVLCRDSVIQGKDSDAMPPVRHAFTRLATGAEQASLIRHEEGTEVLTAESWLRIPTHGKEETLALSTRLADDAYFLWRSIKSAPLIGLSNGSLSQVSLQGAVSVQTAIDQRQWLGAAFVGDGSHAIVVIEAEIAKPSGSRLALWDLSAAAIVESQILEGSISSINVSERGNYGFVLSQSEDKTKLTWLQWQTGNRLGEFEFSDDVTNAAWSADEHYVWISYSDGRKELFVRGENGIEFLRSYSKDVALGFQQKDYLWVVSPNRVELERLSDGRLSVVNAKLSKAIAGVKIDGVTTSNNSDFVLFWGGAGLWSYDSRRDIVEKLATQPVTWAHLDRAGEVLATNLGIVNLFSKLEHQHAYDEKQEPLYWTGDGLYLQTAMGDTFFRVGAEEFVQRHPRSKGLTYIGNSAGVHPASNLTLSLRGDIVSLEDVLPDTTKVRAIFGGVDVHSWCWMTPTGDTQGQGSSCVAINQNSEKADILEPSKQSVVASMQSIKLQRTLSDYSPVELSFNENAKINITTEPDGAWLIFASSEGELPQALVSENVLEKSPFTASLERDERWFAIVVTAPGYVSRTVTFQPIYENFERHIKLLPEAYEGIELKVYFEARAEVPEREVELSSDFEVALKTAFGKERDAILACLTAGDTGEILTFKLSTTCDFEFSGFSNTECGDDIVSDLSDTFNCASNAELSAARGALIQVKF